MQNEHKLQICSVENGRQFLNEYKELLDMYTSRNLSNKGQERIWPDWYRENLHKNMSFVGIYMSQIHYELSYTNKTNR